jgi:hypothetical protein
MLRREPFRSGTGVEQHGRRREQHRGLGANGSHAA